VERHILLSDWWADSQRERQRDRHKEASSISWLRSMVGWQRSTSPEWVCEGFFVCLRCRMWTRISASFPSADLSKQALIENIAAGCFGRFWSVLLVMTSWIMVAHRELRCLYHNDYVCHGWRSDAAFPWNVSVIEWVWVLEVWGVREVWVIDCAEEPCLVELLSFTLCLHGYINHFRVFKCNLICIPISKSI